ncbi:MAG: TVP38/TMEM64 family protein, partial [Maritimibacter sp.]
MTNNISRIWRRAPIVAILVVAVLGAVFLRPYLSFAMLSENRQILIDLVAGHWVLSVGAFIALYIVVVAFSLPGATVMTLTGGFLFGLFPGVLFNIAGASLGAVLLFLAVRMGFGAALA